MKKFATISLSGGLDSSTLLLHLLSKGYDVTAVSINYNQKHLVELQRATELVKYINENSEEYNYETGNKHKFIPVKHQIIKIDGWSQLLNSTLVNGGGEVPEGHYEASNMSQTVVENRNKVFSSIIQSVALAIAKKNKTDVIICMALHAGDHSLYKDCRAEFRDADYNAFLEGNFDAECVTYYLPYLNIKKYDILKDGEKCCEQLGLDFNEVYKRTNTSYKPIYIHTSGTLSEGTFEQGKWYSDYKSASSVERIEAFIKLGSPDPVEYADESGPVSWETAKKHVEQVLLEFQNK